MRFHTTASSTDAKGILSDDAFHEVVRLRQMYRHYVRGQYHDSRVPQPQEVYEQGFRRSGPRRERYDGMVPRFKLHLLCNDAGDIITFCLTGANVDDRDEKVWKVFTKELYGKVFADRGYIKRELSESLFEQGIHLVHGIKANMKNRLMPMWDKIMLRKRYVIECINELLKNKANIVHSRHRSLHNFIMNICSALTAYCSFDNKPEALPVHVENSTQLALF